MVGDEEGAFRSLNPRDEKLMAAVVDVQERREGAEKTVVWWWWGGGPGQTKNAIPPHCAGTGM